MLPDFPQFKNLELNDKDDIESITKKYPPYSDFNFISMWAWDIKGEMRVSKLNENLVVKFNDYVTGEPFYSFLGDNKVNETVESLLELSKKEGGDSVLKLIPEKCTKGLDSLKFRTEEDRDHFDYIYLVEDLKNMHMWSGHRSSKGIEKFLKSHPDYLVKVFSLKEISKKDYLGIFEKWAEIKKIENPFKSNEHQAFKRFLEIQADNIEIVSLYKNTSLVGFTAYEIISGDYAIAHFSKADTKHHSAIYDILNWEEAKSLGIKNIKYYNWEQDLGILGLRKSKIKYKPCCFLKKFFVKSIV